MLRKVPQFKSEMDILTEEVGYALGLTPDQVKRSESFEQSIYDMAKSSTQLPDLNVSGRAQFGFDYEGRDQNGRVKIHYKTHEVSTEPLAKFYNKYFPETQPVYVYGMEQSISFLREPFLQKVIPTMKLWRARPSCIAENNISYVDESDMLLKSSIKPMNDNDAVYITGADPKLGEWKAAFRLDFNQSNRGWEFKLPEGMQYNEFKFLTGPITSSPASVDRLTPELGSNRVLVIHAHLEMKEPLKAEPVGYGARC